MTLLRPDLFREKKGIHIKMDKDVHAAFRAKLFFHNLSMQATLEEFARLVAQDDKTALGIVNNLVMKRVKEQIEETKREDRLKINELDHDTIYNLIEKEDEADSTVD